MYATLIDRKYRIIYLSSDNSNFPINSPQNPIFVSVLIVFPLEVFTNDTYDSSLNNNDIFEHKHITDSLTINIDFTGNNV